jgi:hypothetical protein
MRWVLLEHDRDGIHYDLLVEQEEACITFSFRTDPFDNPTGRCTRKPDHRKHYLTYEGEVAGDRGKVRRVRSGEVLDVSAGKNAIHLRGQFKLQFEIEFTLIDEMEWRYRVRGPK